jgi:Protein of unknown function (DUF2631)
VRPIVSNYSRRQESEVAEVPAGEHHSAVAVDRDGHGEHGGYDAYGNPPETPSVWGWNHDFGKVARIGGWITVILLVLMATRSVTHYNEAGTVALLISAALLVAGLGWDIHRRRTAWRD